MRIIDTELLLTFVRVVETGNFVKAAEAVGRTQSAVSMQMQRLEEVVGQTLFDRTRGRKPELTPQGHFLLVRAREMLALGDTILAELRDPAMQDRAAPPPESAVAQAQREAFTNQVMMTLLTNEKFSAAYASIMHAVETSQDIDPRALSPEDDDRYMALMSMLEYIAIHAMADTLDRAMILRQRRSGLLRVYEKLGTYIIHKREVWRRPNVYRTFERFAQDHLQRELVEPTEMLPITAEVSVGVSPVKIAETYVKQRGALHLGDAASGKSIGD